MTTDLRTTTPPPPSSLHTPQTPRFGLDDDYQPYSPRKSSRVSAQRLRATRTPPPTSSRSSNKAANTSPPSSPPTASKKQTPRTSPNMGGRRVSGALSSQSAASAAVALGLPTPEPQRKIDHNPATAARNNSLLPTPNKTPKKRSETNTGVNAIARNLFPIRAEPADEVMPTPKKGRKKYKGFTMNSFEAEDNGQPIHIYTDSHDRVPEADTSTSNPFYGSSSTAPEPTKRASKRRKINVPGEGELPADEVEHRKDGLVYVFRGKKVFRKFGEEGSEDEVNSDDDDELAQMVEPNLRRPLTRSSIKPRLLFPTPHQTEAKEKRSEVTEDEEEAITDIEEPHGMEVDEDVATPKPARFAPVAPATPPTTVRTLRSKKVDMDSLDSEDESVVASPTHIDSGRGARISPYDNFPRIKSQAGGRSSKKREGCSLGRATKKIRS
ncbi:hypothetical protein D0Z07_3513 [Hyphodiscus hymeniophilus]|uniref:Uncharacterized protein n=1 Tax=Hyphodiscus hymeniophilus TaxID=353542 RepID=A0A9P6VKC3_9HELO|nr:hypothetical protein D0Z07_3513 [Hyphodiscus hymeniophilus]